MTIPYALRLVCVCLASFAIVFAVAGLAVSICAAAALRAAERMRAASAARFILALRLAPALLAAVSVAMICLPSYVRFEQRAESEEVGGFCLLLAVLTASLFVRSSARALAAWRRSLHANAVLALTGVLRHRIVISNAVRTVLSDLQLSMAIRHEEAHAASGDNLKRLLILMTPGGLPRFDELEQAWKRFAEWDADDRAAAGDPQRAVTLAEALVQVAKLGYAAEMPLITAFLAGANDLEARIERLLNPRSTTACPYKTITLSAALPSALLIAAMANPATIHGLLERLIH
jgi:beta-lactamase regulating signal transducer with metallopeptidase domain